MHEGVDSIFGYPGGAVLHIYDELWRARDRITHYLVRHEQGAVHMAEGYARVSGRPGVVCTISGPGVTNVATPVANAYADSIPLLVISSSLPRATPSRGRGELHEVAIGDLEVENVFSRANQADPIRQRPTITVDGDDSVLM